VRLLNHRLQRKSPGNTFQTVPKIQVVRTCGQRRVGVFQAQRTPEASSESTERRRLTAKLESFEPLDGFALVGDNLRLPDQSNGHEAHGDDAKDENEANVGLVSRKAQNAAKPSHGKGSPSTRFDLLAVVR